MMQTTPLPELPMVHLTSAEVEIADGYIEKPLIVQTATHRVTFRRSSYTAVEKVYADNTNNCVAWAKRKTGIYGTFGNGARRGINTQTPQVGAIGAQRSLVHAFVVEEVRENGVQILDSNYVKGWITRRFIPFSDILGYII